MTGTYRALRVVAVLAIVGQIGVAVLLGAELAGTEMYTASPSSHLHWLELVSYGMTPNDFLIYWLTSAPSWILAVFALVVACQTRRWGWLATFIVLLCVSDQVLPYLVMILHYDVGILLPGLANMYRPAIKIGIDLLMAVAALVFTLARPRARPSVSLDTPSAVVA